MAYLTALDGTYLEHSEAGSGAARRDVVCVYSRSPWSEPDEEVSDPDAALKGPARERAQRDFEALIGTVWRGTRAARV
jgi:hypothetical protein